MKTLLAASSVALLSLIACSNGTDGDPSGATGGASSSGGSNSTGGASASGGNPNGTGGASSGGTASGGTASGGTSSGGTASGGAATTGGTSSSGGAMTGGSDGGGGASTGGADGTGGMDSTMAQPSPGCGMSDSGNTNIADAIVTFPAAYDGSTPFPVIFAFHGAGRTNQEFRTVDARTQGHALEEDYIMVYLKSDGNDWLAGSNVTKFESTLDSMSSTNCLDENRVFATGHSSGAQFLTKLLCGGEDRFLGTAPVAGGLLGACNSHPAVNQIYIHGKEDTQRAKGPGAEAAEVVINANMCGSTQPYEQASCVSNQTQVDPGCSEYQDCTQRMVWCSHNDPHYENTNHGWPCFANDAIKTFFDSL